MSWMSLPRMNVHDFVELPAHALEQRIRHARVGQTRQCLGPLERGALAIGEERRLAPGVERVDALLGFAGLPRVRVVHGSGMGILRKALRQFLQKHPHVESVTEPPQNEGGAGATVVELRV